MARILKARFASTGRCFDNWLLAWRLIAYFTLAGLPDPLWSLIGHLGWRNASKVVVSHEGSRYSNLPQHRKRHSCTQLSSSDSLQPMTDLEMFISVSNEIPSSSILGGHSFGKDLATSTKAAIPWQLSWCLTLCQQYNYCTRMVQPYLLLQMLIYTHTILDSSIETAAIMGLM